MTRSKAQQVSLIMRPFPAMSVFELNYWVQDDTFLSEEANHLNLLRDQYACSGS